MSPIAVMAIDIVKNNIGYANKTVKEKIEHITELIETSYKKIKGKNPDALVIASWREYGIFDFEGLDDRVVDCDEKKFFKEAMSKLTLKYPDLVIIGGTVASAKPANGIKELGSKISRMDGMYAKHKFVDEIESKLKTDGDLKFAKERDAFEKYKNEEFIAVSNKCFIFANGKKIDKREKVAPYDEITQTTSGQKFLYRFDKEFSTITVDNKGAQVTVGIEICYEHTLGILKHLVDKQVLQKPMLQFVLSDSVPLDKNNLIGDFVIHIDSRYSIKFLINSDKYDLNDVIVYKVNVDDNEMQRIFGGPPYQEIVTYVEIIKEKLEEYKKEFETKGPINQEFLSLYNTIKNKIENIIAQIATSQNSELDQYKEFASLSEFLRGYARFLSLNQKSYAIDEQNETEINKANEKKPEKTFDQFDDNVYEWSNSFFTDEAKASSGVASTSLFNEQTKNKPSKSATTSDSFVFDDEENKGLPLTTSTSLFHEQTKQETSSTSDVPFEFDDDETKGSSFVTSTSFFNVQTKKEFPTTATKNDVPFEFDDDENKDSFFVTSTSLFNEQTKNKSPKSATTNDGSFQFDDENKDSSFVTSTPPISFEFDDETKNSPFARQTSFFFDKETKVASFGSDPSATNQPTASTLIDLLMDLSDYEAVLGRQTKNIEQGPSVRRNAT